MVSKLVRDKIPELMKQDGKDPLFHVADPDEFIEALREKLQEEVDEFLEAETEDELVDVLEVLFSFCIQKGWAPASVEAIRQAKARDKGSFERRMILDRS